MKKITANQILLYRLLLIHSVRKGVINSVNAFSDKTQLEGKIKKWMRAHREYREVVDLLTVEIARYYEKNTAPPKLFDIFMDIIYSDILGEDIQYPPIVADLPDYTEESDSDSW